MLLARAVARVGGGGDIASSGRRSLLVAAGAGCCAAAAALASSAAGPLSTKCEQGVSVPGALEAIDKRLRRIECTMSAEPERSVLVVGAGIVGASIALQLSRQGCSVTVLEADAQPASYSSTTSKSWAWINSNSKKPQSYHDLNAASMELWRQQDLVPVQWCGALVCRNGAAPIHPPDYPSGPVTAAEMAQLEPGLDPGSQSWSFYPTEGLLEPVQAAELMIDEAKRLGCEVKFGTHVLEVKLDAPDAPSGESTAVRTEVGTFYADCVVLAAGNFVPELLDTTGCGVTIPTANKPGLLVHTTPLPLGTINTIVASPCHGVHMLQRPNGSGEHITIPTTYWLPFKDIADRDICDCSCPRRGHRR